MMPMDIAIQNQNNRLRRCVLCPYVFESEPERIRHVKLDHPGICHICHDPFLHLDRNIAEEREIVHRLLCHQDLCPFCEHSNAYSSYFDKVRHMQGFHNKEQASPDLYK